MENKYKKILEYWLAKNKELFLQEVLNASDAQRVLETFPFDIILDLIDLLNSNSGIVLLNHYGDELVDIIAKEIGADKYKITPRQLKMRINKAKKEA